MVRLRNRLFNSGFIIVFASAMAVTAYSQSTQSSEPSRSSDRDRTQANAKTEELQRRLDELRKDTETQKQQFEKRLEMQNETLNRQLESVSRTTEWMFRIMAGIALIGSLFGAVSWFKSRQDYQQERTFYEARLKLIDENQEKLTKQQIAMGEKLLMHSDEMLVKQIDSIGGLGSVIDLVKRTFEMQLSRQQEFELVSDLRNHFDEVYKGVCERILSFAEHSRMSWTQLSSYEESLANSARSDFRTIPDAVLKRHQEKDRYNFARVLQLLGVSAFYANDIEWAERH